MSGFFEQAKSKVCLSEGTRATMRPLVSTWEQRKLNECLTVSSEKNSNGAFKRNDVLSVSKDFGVINQIAFQGRSFAGADLSNYGVLNHGEIVYTKSPLKDNPFGIIKSNKSRSGIVSTLYAIYRPLDGTLANFIDCYFSQDARVNNYLHPLISKGAKNDMKVSAENALKGTISIPSVAEQKMICELLAQLDSLITLHQREPPHTMKEGKNANRYQWRIAFLRLLLAMD